MWKPQKYSVLNQSAGQLDSGGTYREHTLIFIIIIIIIFANTNHISITSRIRRGFRQRRECFLSNTLPEVPATTTWQKLLDFPFLAGYFYNSIQFSKTKLVTSFETQWSRPFEQKENNRIIFNHEPFPQQINGKSVKLAISAVSLNFCLISHCL